MHLLVLPLLPILSFVAAVPAKQQQQHLRIPADSAAQAPIHNEEEIPGIRDALKAAHIIPTVLNDFAPQCLLEITYYSTSLLPSPGVHYGNYLSPNMTKSAPFVHVSCSRILGSAIPQDVQFAFPGEDGKDDKDWRAMVTSESGAKNSSFVLALTDPDAPSRKKPKWSEMCHWIGLYPSVKGRKSVMPYKSPGPPKNTGPHRYVFVLLHGNDISNISAPSDREHWGFGKPKKRKGGDRKYITRGVQDWADDMGLSVVSANWFVAEHE